MEFHPIANIFPMMTGDDYRALVQDISDNGIMEPITLYQGQILDGRNRWTACLELGIDPPQKEYTGDNPLAYVVSLNLVRRHLSESQRGMIAARMANAPAHRPESAPIGALISQPEAAELMNVSTRTVKSAKQVIEQGTPELIRAVDAGEMTVNAAIKEIKKIDRQERRAELARVGEATPINQRWNIHQANINEYQTDKRYDFIITDPPYPKEYLPLYGVLAKRSAEWLKPGGLLVAMCGQSYLNEIYELMGQSLEYYWTACYLTPGQATALWQKQVISNWKPVLIYGINRYYGGKIFSDVYKSDSNDKALHKWGQSVSGLYSLVRNICLPGQSILDPFCGAGSTGVAALMHGCLFDGLDIDQESVNITRGRLAEYDSEAQ